MVLVFGNQNQIKSSIPTERGGELKRKRKTKQRLGVRVGEKEGRRTEKNERVQMIILYMLEWL